MSQISIKIGVNFEKSELLSSEYDMPESHIKFEITGNTAAKMINSAAGIAKKLFLDTFKKQGIDIDKIFVERAGNLGSGPAADNKKVIFKKYLDTKIYKRIRLFDDANSNLKMFLSLQKEYPEVSFEAFLAKHNGSVKRVR